MSILFAYGYAPALGNPCGDINWGVVPFGRSLHGLMGFKFDPLRRLALYAVIR